MRKKIKKVLKNEKSVSKLIFSAIIIGAVVLVLESGVSAYFKRTALDSDFDYGYGYGYNGTNYAHGYGYGYGANISGGYTYGFWGTNGNATSVSVASTENTITVSYFTNYLARNRIEYGTTVSLGSASSWSGWQSGLNSITVSSLNCGTTYYYRVATQDAGGNTWYTAKSTQVTVDCETETVFSQAIEKLVKADQLLTKVAIHDARNTPVQDPKKQKKVDHEIKMAEKELAKAYQELGKDKPDKAIKRFENSWKHAQQAIKHAEKTKGKEK